MTHQHIVKLEEANIRLDKLLTNLDSSYSRHQVQQWIKAGLVFVDGEKGKANYKCKEGSIIQWSIPVEEEIVIQPEEIPLEILYEDNYILLVNKPTGMLVHPTKQIQTNTLVNALKYHSSTLSNLSGEERAGIVHRLDKDTSGVMIVAKDNASHEHLQQQFKQQTVRRIYEAIVDGVVSPNKGIIQAPIGRDPNQRLKRTVDPDGKEAVTHFDVLRRFNQHTHVQCELMTGRTHQIRVHMKYMNHAIIGDYLYSDKTSEFIQGQALFAKELQFIHPHTLENMTIMVEQPPYFYNLLKKLEKMA